MGGTLHIAKRENWPGYQLISFCWISWHHVKQVKQSNQIKMFGTGLWFRLKKTKTFVLVTLFHIVGSQQWSFGFCPFLFDFLVYYSSNYKFVPWLSYFAHSFWLLISVHFSFTFIFIYCSCLSIALWLSHLLFDFDFEYFSFCFDFHICLLHFIFFYENVVEVKMLNSLKL